VKTIKKLPLLCALQAEIDRLAENFKYSEDALAALQMVRCWAEEESVPLESEDFDEHMEYIKK